LHVLRDARLLEVARAPPPHPARADAAIMRTPPIVPLGMAIDATVATEIR
jgi:hypothetical protein